VLILGNPGTGPGKGRAQSALPLQAQGPAPLCRANYWGAISRRGCLLESELFPGHEKRWPLNRRHHQPGKGRSSRPGRYDCFLDGRLAIMSPLPMHGSKAAAVLQESGPSTARSGKTQPSATADCARGRCHATRILNPDTSSRGGFPARILVLPHPGCMCFLESSSGKRERIGWNLPLTLLNEIDLPRLEREKARLNPLQQKDQPHFGRYVSPVVS